MLECVFSYSYDLINSIECQAYLSVVYSFFFLMREGEKRGKDQGRKRQREKGGNR